MKNNILYSIIVIQFILFVTGINVPSALAQLPEDTSNFGTIAASSQFIFGPVTNALYNTAKTVASGDELVGFIYGRSTDGWNNLIYGAAPVGGYVGTALNVGYFSNPSTWKGIGLFGSEINDSADTTTADIFVGYDRANATYVNAPTLYMYPSGELAYGDKGATANTQQPLRFTSDSSLAISPGGDVIPATDYATVNLNPIGGNYLSLRIPGYTNGLTGAQRPDEILEVDYYSATNGGAYFGGTSKANDTSGVHIDGNVIAASAIASGSAAIELNATRANTSFADQTTAAESLVQITKAYGSPLWDIKGDGREVVSTPNSAPSDTILGNGQVTFYLDQAGNALKFRVKYSDGTLKTGSISLS